MIDSSDKETSHKVNNSADLLATLFSAATEQGKMAITLPFFDKLCHISISFNIKLNIYFSPRCVLLTLSISVLKLAIQ